MPKVDIKKMQEKIRHVVAERDWEKFHTPKNLSISLLLEASELMEIFQWLNEKESYEICQDEKKMAHIRDELADVFFWVIRIADHFQIDLEKAFWEKMKKNEKKYPVHLAKGVATKYTELKKKKR